MNTLMLMLAVRLGGARICPIRVLLGAVCGAMIAQAASGLSRMQMLLVWLPAAMLMMRIAQGKGAWGGLIKEALMLFCAAGLTGGMVLCFLGVTGSLSAAYALGGAAAMIIGLCAARTRKKERGVKRVRIICMYRGKQAMFDAMIDSGNTLRDYLTHRPVIVMAEQTVQKALNLEDTPLRPIFAQTAGGRQRMHVFMPEEITLELDGIRHGVQAVIALSPQMSTSVPALVPTNLTDDFGNINRGG